MDPNAAITTFNSETTCRAERSDIAYGLLNWLESGGFKPSGTFEQRFIDALRRHNEWNAALAADRANEIIEGS